MAKVDVDFEVFKELTLRRRSEEITMNDVIRELLKLPQPADGSTPPLGEASWVAKGVSFPHGTKFRAAYGGQQYIGKIQNGALIVKGTRFKSPSAAAVSITGKPTNGWLFWECLLSGDTRWQVIKTFRGF